MKQFLYFAIFIITQLLSPKEVLSFSLDCNTLLDITEVCSNYQDGTLGSSTDINNDQNFSEEEYVSLTGSLLAKYNLEFGTPSCQDTENPNANLTVHQEYQLIETNCATSIKRRYRVSDGTSFSNWTVQQIQFEYIAGWEMIFSSNFTLGCEGPILPVNQTIQIQNGPCDQLTYTTKDSLVELNGCVRTERTYSIKNQCLYNDGDIAEELPNISGGALIRGVDNPSLRYLKYTQFFDRDDCIKPQIVLRNNLNFEIPTGGSATISARYFVQYAQDDCSWHTDLIYRIWHEKFGTLPTSIDDIFNLLPENISFDCTDLGEQLITVFVFDESRNYEVMNTSIDIFGAENCNCVVDTIKIHDNPLGDGSYQSIKTIETTAKILNGANVNLSGGNSVILKSGFHAQNGSSLNVLIENCQTEFTDMSNSKILEIEEEESILLTDNIQLLIYPNPLKNEAAIDLTINEDIYTSLVLVDINGKIVNQIMTNTFLNEGQYSFRLDAQDLSNGIYFAQLMTNNEVVVKKLLVTK
ncbi:MAG: T9SS type A sorting domain-containing protein [Bacteroidota bacterium]